MVSTVLLIMIVIILAMIIILWSGVFFKEAITKEIAGKKKTAEQYCSEIVLQPFINPSDDKFGFKNIGNVPIHAVKVKTSNQGSSDITDVESLSGNLANPGFSATIPDKFYDNYEKVKIIPIVLGTSESGGIQKFTCPESTAWIV